jgi:hypothetical protein
MQKTKNCLNIALIRSTNVDKSKKRGINKNQKINGNSICDKENNK